MKDFKMPKKILSVLLAVSMMLSCVPVPAYAVTTDNLCDHHTAHTAECGYAEAVAGVACGHEHSEDCYAIVQCIHEHDESCGTDGVDCVHECTVDNGCITMELDCHHTHGDCGYSEGTAEVSCGHQHDGSCGYVEAVAEVLCACAETDESGALIHTEGCGYVAAVEGQPCGHTEHLDCGYAPATEGTPCTHTHAVKVDSADSCYKLLCSHSSGGHDDACGYVASVDRAACTYHCEICHVQELIDALPGEVTAENAEAVAAQLTAIDSEKESLSDEEQAQVDFTKYTAAAEALGSVYAAVPAEDATCTCTTKCAEGTVNTDCAVCSAEGADLTACTGTESATTGTITGYASDSDGEACASTTDCTGTYANGICSGCGGYQPAVLNEDYVYEISNAGQLYWFAAVVNGGYGYVGQNLGANAILTENITVNENVLKADGTLNGDGTSFRVWTPIGTDTNRYIGTFDGNNKTVSGLYFNDSATSYVGLFSSLSSVGTVKNVGVVDSYLNGNECVGGVVGYNGGTVNNCYNSGTVSGSSQVGGVVGYLNNGTVQSCYNTGAVSGSDEVGNHVGGVVGSNDYGTVRNCYNTGTVTGYDYVGGVVGSNDDYGTVQNCYNTGTVSGSSQVGGVVGYLSGGTVQNCYNSGSVSGSIDVGGVVGYNGGTVTNCYYLSGTAAGGIDGSDVTGSAEAKTAAQFASGEVAYLLNGDQSTIVFKQTLGTDGYPSFTGAQVYYGYNSCAEAAAAIYTNDSTVSAEKPTHSGGTATCKTHAVCKICNTSYGELNPDNHESDKLTYTANEDGTNHTATYSCCGTTVTEGHKMDATTGKCVCGLDMAKASVTTAGDTPVVTYYETLEEAITAAQTATGSTVQLLDSVTLSDTIYITTGQFTIDLNGKTVTSASDYDAFSIYTYDPTVEGTNVTIISTVSGGKIESSDKLSVSVGDDATARVIGVELNAVYASGTLTLENVKITASREGITAGGTGTGNVTILGNSSISGDICDVVCGTYATITLGEGVTFPDGLTAVSVSGYKALNTMLADGMAYWQGDNKMLRLTSDTYEISGGTVTVKAVCTHEGGTPTYAPIEGGTQHTATYSCCGTTVTEDHSGGEATCQEYAVCEICGTSYGELNSDNHDSSVAFNEKGFCPNCGEYEPATDSDGDGYYEIGNAGQLYWFAEQVNGEAIANTSNAVLTADIDLENRAWTPIGRHSDTDSSINLHYSGTFDGQNHVIKNLSVLVTTTCEAGLFSRVESGTLQNFGIINATVENTQSVRAGVVAGEIHKSTVTNVFTAGAITVTTSNVNGQAGGIAGECASTTLTNCYTTYGMLTANKTAPTGVTNCYYLAESENIGSCGEFKTADQFASGEVAYLLQGEQETHVWGQTLGTENADAYPTLGGAKVYSGYTSCANEAAVVYTNTESIGKPHTYENGICEAVEGEIHYEPAVLNESGIYEIGNAGQLIWFAEQINSGAIAKDVNAILTDNIDMNGIDWTPICSTGLYYDTTTYTDKGYEGTFDGGGHTISNLKITGTDGVKASYGLFGTLSGTVKNLGMSGMTFSYSGSYNVDTTDARAGAIAGQMLDGSLISDCFVVDSSLTPNNYIVGGIAGCNYAGTIQNCYTKNVTISAHSRCGNLVSDTRGDISTTDRPGTVKNCYTNASRVVGTNTSGSEYITGCAPNIPDSIFASGEITYKLNADRTETVWYQKDGMPAFSGSIVYENICEGQIFYSTTDGDFDSHDIGSDYRCTNCGNYEPATLVTAENYSSLGLDSSYVGYYAIKNASNLYWYSERERMGDISGSIVLLNDIILDDSEAEWVPIVWEGDCTFDGRGNTITLNLDYGTTQRSENYGLFGTCNYSVVKNLFLDGNIKVNTTGHVGAVAGSMYRSTVSGVISYVNVTNSCTTSGSVGGLAGCFGGQHDSARNQYSKIENSAVYANVTGYNAGGLVGEGWGGNQYWDITNAAYVGNVTTNNTTSGTAGAIVGYQNTDNYTSTFTNIYWNKENGLDFYGKRDTENQVYTNTEAKTKDQFASGEVACLLQGEQTEHVWGQLIGIEKYPVLGSEKVLTDESGGYYNDCVNVLISWTAMEFTYTAGEWDPETHTSGGGTWEAAPGGGQITVTNLGGKSVTAKLTFTPVMDGISGSFDKPGAHLAMGGKFVSTLTLTGTPAETGFTNAHLGNVVVTITGEDTDLGDVPSHTLGSEITYTWAENYSTCTASAVCTGCGSAVEVDTVNAVYAVTTTSTCTVKGTGTYTANFTAEGLAAQTKEVELPLDPDAHSFDENGKCACGAIQITDVNAPNDADHPFGDGWSNDEEEGLDSSAASIGTQDVGKTAWVNKDQIIVTLTSETIGTQTCVLTYDGGNWTLDGSFVYAEGETPTVTAVYAPASTLGMGDYIPANCTFAGGSITINFNGVTRNYSRLRIVGLPNQTLTVTTTGFTPAGASAAADGTTYTVTTNGDGNAFLYGTFAVDATVSVKYGDVVLKDYTFTAENNPNGTEQGKSYALDARPIIDGTFGGKTTASEEDVAALVEQIKTYVDNGITTITVTGSNPAIIDMGSYTNTAIGEAIYRLSGSGTHNADNPYNGKIDLILPDVTEIVDWEFQKAYALNSINLPKVTTIGVEGFDNCLYLQKLTFGSVVTSIKDGTGFAFCDTGASVGGCHLVLNRGQASAATDYQPDPLNNLWWKTNWKYIELY